MLRKISLFVLAFTGMTAMFAYRLPTREIRILYIGNSLTYVNDLPALVRELGALDGNNIISNSFLFPDYSLEDHWKEGKAEDEIDKGIYDFVILQQGPSALPASQGLLLDYAGRFADACKKNNAKPALYMVWPSKTRSFDLDNVITSYTTAAQKTSSVLCPAGLAWKYAWQNNAELALYSADEFHPSLTGSLLAALTLYGAITDKTDFNFVALKNCSWSKDIGENEWIQIVNAAIKSFEKK